MKIHLKILMIFMLLMSCQSKNNENHSLSDSLERDLISQKNSHDHFSDLQSKTTLTKAQSTAFFPKQIAAYKLVNVSVLMSNTLASALYIKDNDYDKSMTYSLEDGNRKGSAVIQNFEDSYNLRGHDPEGTEYIYKERDGYKTIAFLQPIINRNDLWFVYNNRFRISLNGTAGIDTLWSYIKKEDLKQLDNY